MKKQVRKVYDNLQKKKKAIKIRAFLMAGLLLAINSFAWFVFITDGTGKISADVINWDIAFLDEEGKSEMIDVEITDLYPGMPTFTKGIIIMNKSDLDAEFNCSVEKIIAFGEEYTTDDLINSLEIEFPFKITFGYDNTELDKGDSLPFNVIVNWPFESDVQYYKLNHLYEYIKGINYYQLDGDTYNEIEVSEENFEELVDSGLYVESDDADTYWGEKSVAFKENFPDDSVIRLKVKLTVSQRKE